MGNCWNSPKVYDQEVKSRPDETVYMNIHMQDPRLRLVQQKAIPVTGHFSSGPRSEDVEIVGMPHEYEPTDSNGNFLYDATDIPEAADAVHCVVVISQVLDMYRLSLERIGQPGIMCWQWGSRPLGVRPYAGQNPIACYSRSRGELLFYQTRSPSTKEMIRLCRSYDVVAHMAGHAVLDGLKPIFYGNHITEEVRALAESFADLTAIFSFISQMEMCERIVQYSKGDLTNLSAYVPDIESEELRNIFWGREFGLRSVKLGVKISDVVAEHHDWSRCFTSAIYEILVKMSMMELESNTTQAQLLHQSSQHLCGLVLRAYLEAPIFDATFRDLAKYIQSVEPDAKVRAIIKEEFRSRKIFDKYERPKRWHGVNIISGCTTMSTVETVLF